MLTKREIKTVKNLGWSIVAEKGLWRVNIVLPSGTRSWTTPSLTHAEQIMRIMLHVYAKSRISAPMRRSPYSG